MAETFGIVTVITGVSAGAKGHLKSFNPSSALGINEAALDESGNVIRRHLAQEKKTGAATFTFVADPSLDLGDVLVISACPVSKFNGNWHVISDSYNESFDKYAEFTLNLECDASVDVEVNSNPAFGTPTPSPTPTP